MPPQGERAYQEAIKAKDKVVTTLPDKSEVIEYSKQTAVGHDSDNRPKPMEYYSEKVTRSPTGEVTSEHYDVRDRNSAASVTDYVPYQSMRKQYTPTPEGRESTHTETWTLEGRNQNVKRGIDKTTINGQTISEADYTFKREMGREEREKQREIAVEKGYTEEEIKAMTPKELREAERLVLPTRGEERIHRIARLQAKITGEGVAETLFEKQRKKLDGKDVFVVSPKFMELWKEREPEFEEAQAREQARRGLIEFRKHLELTPAALVVKAAIESGEITTLKEIREVMPERTRERESLEQEIIDKFKKIIQEDDPIERAKEYFPALVTHRIEMEEARKQLKYQEIYMGTKKGEYLLTGMAPSLHPVKTALIVGALATPVLGLAGGIPVIGKIVTSKYLAGGLLGAYGAGEVISGIKKVEEEPAYYKRPSGYVEMGLGTVTELGGFITGAAISRGVIGALPIVRVKTKVKKIEGVDKVGYGREKIIKKTTIDIIRGRGTEGIRAYQYVSPTGRVKIRYAKLYDFPKKPIKVIDSVITKPTEVTYPPPMVRPFYAPVKTYPSFIRSVTGLGYTTSRLGIGKTYRPEVYGYTKAMVDKMKRDIAIHLKKKFKPETLFKVDKVVKSKIATKHKLPKAPKGYKWVETEIPDSLGRVQIQIQLVKLKEPELRLRRVLLQRQQQLQKQRLKTRQVSKQVLVSRQVSAQKQALSLNQLLGSESIQKSSLAQLLGIGLLSAQQQAQAQKLRLLQTQRLSLISLQTPLSAQVQVLKSVQAQEQVTVPLLALKSAQALELVSAQAQALELAQPQIQIQEQALELETPLITTGILKKPEKKRGIGEIKAIPKDKGFDTYVREGEKRTDRFRRVAKNLPRHKALRKGRDIVDNYIEATYRIKSSGKKTKIIDDPLPPNLDKFRSPRPKSKLPRDSLIEMARHRLDSAKELQQISYFKELARKKKQLEQRITFIKTQQKQQKKQQLRSMIATKQINFIKSSGSKKVKKQKAINILKGRGKSIKFL